MNEQIFASMSKSAEAFQRDVWPVVSKHPLVGGGALRPVEAVSASSFKDELDLYAGIDAWQIFHKRGAMRGIASRVQWDKTYRTFTIRYSKVSGKKTEYDKRLDAIQSEAEGFVYPHLTVHAYFDSKENKLIAVAAIPTKDLILKAKFLLSKNVIKDDGDTRFGLRKLNDGTEFIYLSWEYLAHTDLKDSLAYIDLAP